MAGDPCGPAEARPQQPHHDGGGQRRHAAGHHHGGLARKRDRGGDQYDGVDRRRGQHEGQGRRAAGAGSEQPARHRNRRTFAARQCRTSDSGDGHGQRGSGRQPPTQPLGADERRDEPAQHHAEHQERQRLYEYAAEHRRRDAEVGTIGDERTHRAGEDRQRDEAYEQNLQGTRPHSADGRGGSHRPIVPWLSVKSSSVRQSTGWTSTGFRTASSVR